MRLFDVPTGEAMEISMGTFRCGKCGIVEEDVTLTLEATDLFCDSRGPNMRKWLHIHNHLCSCHDGIWLTDGPVVLG